MSDQIKVQTLDPLRASLAQMEALFGTGEFEEAATCVIGFLQQTTGTPREAIRESAAILLERYNELAAENLAQSNPGPRDSSCASLLHIHKRVEHHVPPDRRMRAAHALAHELCGDFRRSIEILGSIANANEGSAMTSRIRRDMKLAENVLAGAGRYPDFILLGAQKAGTTSFYDMMCAHPDCLPCVRKEAHFFDTDLNYARGLAYYRAHFVDDTERARIAIEKTPIYLAHAAARERIVAMPAKPGLIAILRHPVDRAWSGYRMGAERRPMQHPPFDRVLRDAAQRYRDDPASGQVNLFGRGDYANQLRAWFTHLPRERFLILGFDEWVNRNPDAMRAIESFMGIRIEGVPTPHSRAGTASTLDPAVRERLSALYRDSDEELFELIGRRLY